MLVDQRANLLERHPSGSGINRQHAPFVGPIRLLAQVDELAWMQLPSVKEADGSGEEQNVILANRPIEKWLTWPGNLDHAGVVAHDCLKDSQPLSRGDHSFGDHRPDDRGIHPGLQRRDGRDRARIFIPMRQVIEQILGSDDVETPERLGSRWADALEVHHRGAQGPQGARRSRLLRRSLTASISSIASIPWRHSSSSSRAYSSASNSSRSSAASPTPTNLIGTSIASCTAMTMPPRAVPSTLVTTTPVSGMAWANERACATAFCPMVASSTSSVS